MEVLWLLDQALGRDAEPSVQFPGHFQGQWPLMVKNFVDPVQSPDHWLKVLRGETHLFHAELDRFNRIVNRMSRFDDRGQARAYSLLYPLPLLLR